MDAVVIIVREGFEAMLILTALAAYLVKVGQGEKRVLIYGGGGAAVLASLALGRRRAIASCRSAVRRARRSRASRC